MKLFISVVTCTSNL